MTKHGKKWNQGADDRYNKNHRQSLSDERIEADGGSGNGATDFHSRNIGMKILVALAAVTMLAIAYGLATQNTSASVIQSASATGSTPETTASVDGGYQVIHMNVTSLGWQPDSFVLKAGVPVKWVIDGQQLTGCNKAIKVPSLGLTFDIKKGEQTIEFTPAQAGTIPFSCWMGMIRGTFIVKDNIDTSNTQQVQQALAEAPPVQKGGSCNMGGGGGCGCGMM